LVGGQIFVRLCVSSHSLSCASGLFLYTAPRPPPSLPTPCLPPSGLADPAPLAHLGIFALPASLWQRAKLSQKHGVSVESVVMKHDHKEVVGRAKGHVDVSEAKAKAVQKAIARAIHQVCLSCTCPCSPCSPCQTMCKRGSPAFCVCECVCVCVAIARSIPSGQPPGSVHTYIRRCGLCTSAGAGALCGCTCMGATLCILTCKCADVGVQKGAATVKAADALQGKRGRGGDQKTDAEIKALAKQMRQSIKALDGKIQKLDESSASGLRSAHMVGLLSVLVALLAAQAH
jgi:hypothetical protein